MARQRATSLDIIVRSAAELFDRQGYRATTIDQIAELVGVSKPTIYAYVPSKDELLAHVFEKGLKQLLDTVEDVQTRIEDRGERLVALITEVVCSAVSLRHFLSVTLSTAGEVEPAVTRKFRRLAREFNGELETIISDAQGHGRARADIDPKIAAQLLTGMISSLIRWYEPEDPTEPDLDEMAKNVVKMLSGFIAQAPQMSPP